MADFETVLAHMQSITRLKKVRDGWVGCCPWHDDSNASFKLWANGGFLCLGCGIKGGLDNLSARIFNAPVVPYEDKKSCHKTKGVEFGQKIAEYVYRDEVGQPIYKVIRYNPKAFSQMRWDSEVGCYIWGTKNTRRVLYNLFEICKSNKNRLIFFVEGERDCETLGKHGLLSTTCPMGAGGGWRPEYADSLKGRNVITIPDNDPIGVELMSTIRIYLISRNIANCEEWRVPFGKDITEWIELGGDIKELTNIASRYIK